MPVLLLLLALLAVCSVAGLVARRRDFPGRRSFLLLHLSILWWVAAAALELAVWQPDCKVLAAQLAWPGIIGTPTCWAIFLWEYVNSRHQRLPRAYAMALAMVLLLFWLVVLGNDWHHAVYSAATAPASAEPGAPIRYVHGPLFFLIAVYVYALMSFSVLAALSALRRAPAVYRRHYLGFVLVTCLPWLANLPYVLFDRTLFGFDPTPFSFMLTSLVFSWLIGRRQLFDLLPIARYVLLEALPDPVLVIDLEQRVVEANQAACLLAAPDASLVGRTLGDCPLFGAKLEALLAGPGDSLLALSERQRYFELSAVPLHRGDTTLGRLLLLRDVSKHHLSELQRSQTLLALERQLDTTSQLQRQLHEQAIRDPLTGLYNRRYLDEVFQRELAEAEREQRALALLLLDLDHFKQLNDNHGHLAGDEVLRGVAQRLGELVRESDLVFRFGGEEILLLLPGADLNAAMQRGEAIRADIAGQAWPSPVGPLQVTLSAGIASWPQHGQSLAALLQSADQALYAAKHAGRNRVLLALD